jgi:hypothetical protein
MEALLVREGNNYTYRSPALAVSSSTNQTATISTLQVDGFSTTVSLVIKYKKGTSNKVDDMLSRPPIAASIILKNTSLSHDSYVEQYAIDEDFKEVYEKLTHGAQVENYCLQGKLLYHLGKLCIPTSE